VKLVCCMQRILLAVTLGLTATQFASGDPVYLGQEAVVSQSWYSCPNKDDLQFLKELSGRKWRAAHSYAQAHGCTLLKAGDTAVVADALIRNGDTCLRIMPVGGCYWFPEAYVTPADSAVGSIR